MIMKAIIEEGTPELASRMQELSLSEGALPRHLHGAMFTQSVDARMLTLRQLSRTLVALWCAGHQTALALLARILPPGLLQALYSNEQVPRDRDLLNTRDNLSLAIEHNNEQTNTAKQQMIIRGRRLQRQLLNTQSVRVLEKQLSNAMQHWKQRMGTISGSGPSAGGSTKADDKVNRSSIFRIFQQIY